MNITDIITAKTLTLNELQQNKQIGYEKDGVISKIDPKYLPDTDCVIDESDIPDTIARTTYVDEETTAKINELKTSGGVGYTETAWQEVAPQQSVDVAYMEEVGMTVGVFNSTADFEVGDKAKIIFDGVLYKCSYVEIEGTEYAGNGSFIGLENTGEPFFIQTNGEESIIVCEEGTHILSIEKINETVFTIDPKFTPCTNPIRKVKLDFYITEELLDGEEQEKPSLSNTFAKINECVSDGQIPVLNCYQDTAFYVDAWFVYPAFIARNREDVRVSAFSATLPITRRDNNEVSVYDFYFRSEAGKNFAKAVKRITL